MSITARFGLQLGVFQMHVDLQFPGQGVTAIFGPSGSGKTSLLRVLAGLERCHNGYLEVRGEVWQDENRFLPPHRRPLGYVFQEPSLFEHLDVKQNLHYGLSRTPEGRRRISWEQAVSLLGLEPLMKRHTSGLSGGEKQRVAIARSLLTSPHLLLMDEPLASLDAASKKEILPFLELLHEELDLPIVYVSHSADEVAQLADHLVLLEEGRVQASGPIQEMLTRLDLSLSRGEDAEALISAVVVGHDASFELAQLDFGGGMLLLSGDRLPLGKEVRLRILARDVSLTLERQTGTSILNILPARVEEIVTEGPAQNLVRLQAGEVQLLSRITRKSTTILELKPGKPVFAQIKSVAVLA